MAAKENDLQLKITASAQQLSHQKIMNRVRKLFDKFEKDKVGNVAIKMIYKSLCGQPKFEVNTILDKANFIRFIEYISQIGDDQQEKIVPTDIQLEALLGKWEKISAECMPYANDMENDEFMEIISKMKAFQVKA